MADAHTAALPRKLQELQDWRQGKLTWHTHAGTANDNAGFGTAQATAVKNSDVLTPPSTKDDARLADVAALHR